MKKALSNRNVIAIVGPTASGKTAFSIELAHKLDAEIISADSRLVYKGFDIGTAKPSMLERQGIVHHMIDIVEPDFEYSAGLYAQQAKSVIYDMLSREKIPIIVGGTGLYIDILLRNYNMPNIEADKELRDKLSEKGNEELYNLLSEYDNDAAQSIDSNDRYKIIRAIEIIKISGKKLKDARSIADSEFNVKWYGCNYPRDILYDRINSRVDLMVEQGLIEETQKLLEKHGRIPNLINTIGYREIIRYLDKKTSKDEAINLLKQNTRHYAKRQMTWFRKNPDIEWNCYPDKLKK